MNFLRAVRMGLLIVIAVVAIGFTVLNPAETVNVNLYFLPPIEGVPMVFALFCAFLLGLVGGLAIGAIRLVEMSTKLREAKRSRHQVEGELTTLRNLPLEEGEGGSTASSAP